MPAGPPPSSKEEILPRQFGKYTLLRSLAAGGMAKVYLAIQRAVAGFEKLVVIKRILPELSSDQAFVEMLLSEARTAATLNHPNIVQTFDVGEVEGTYYIAMEHINGEDIRSVVRAMRRASVTEFPLEHTLSIILAVCAGLAYAHDKRDLDGEPLSIVHRDISPQNVLITFSGDIKVVDFGIAKSTQAGVGESTAAGQLKGKVPYMSPEQAAGQDIDLRSDIFAVGIMLFELTTGRRLFKAKSEFETLKLICERDYPRPSQVKADYPEQLEKIVMKALAKNRDKRYQTAREMQADLESFIRDERIAASAVSLGAWMKMLFQDKIEEQKEALQDVKQLADVIASQRMTDPGEMFVGTTTGAQTYTDVSQTAFPAHQKSSSTGWVLAAVAMLLVVAGAGFFFMQRQQGETKGPATPSTVVVVKTAEPEPKGTLKVTSTPEGAYIRVAGELQSSKTPATLENLPLGIELEVKLSLEGHEDHVSRVELSEDEMSQDIEVKLTKGSAVIEFTVVPVLALVNLDGKRIDSKQKRIEKLAAGEHKMVFSAPGHVTQVVKIMSKKGETKKIDIVLVKGDGKPSGTGKPPEPKGQGTVSVASRGGFCTNTTVGGKSVGPTPTPPTQVKSGPVSIICTTADGRRVPSGTVVKPGGRTRVTITIPPK